MSTARYEPVWQVYWLHDRKGRLVWVGHSRNLTSRLNWHRSHSPWWSDVDPSQPVPTRAYPTEAAMKAAEAIELAERPGRENKQGVPGRAPKPASPPWQSALVAEPPRYEPPRYSKWIRRKGQ